VAISNVRGLPDQITSRERGVIGNYSGQATQVAPTPLPGPQPLSKLCLYWLRLQLMTIYRRRSQ